MICANCQAAIPDESTFCLKCGTRLLPVERLAPVNGGGAGSRHGEVVLAGSTRSAPAVAPRPPAGPGGREAYALSFKALTDERLRYRVARWLCEVAPAHHLTEVQEGLSASGFATVLALTPAEADSARDRIQALGAHPALWQLRPATVAEMMLPPRSRKPEVESGWRGWTIQKKAAVVGVALLILFIIGMIARARL